MKANSFQEFVADQLEDIPGFKFRRMFSGFGIYSDEVFFGIINGERLYFHINDQSKKRYEDAGMTFFTAPGSKKPLRLYYEVPPSVLEDRREAVFWAREAIATVDGAELLKSSDLPPRRKR